MEKDNNNIENEIIIRYLDGELSHDELNAFEARIQSDKAFAEEVELYKSVIKGIQLNEKIEISEKITIASDHNQENAVTNNQIQKTIAMKQDSAPIKKSLFPLIAAAVAILIAGYFWMNQTSTYNPDQLFEDNYSQSIAALDGHIKGIASMNIGTRGAVPGDTTMMIFNGEEVDAITFAELEKNRRAELLVGLNSFKKSEWRTAVTQLNEYVTSYSVPLEDQSKAVFYLAKARLNAGVYAPAVNSYNEFLSLKINDKVLNDQAEWDRALCYIKMDQAQVKKYLDEIAKDNGHTYQDDAKGLISYFE